MKYDRRGVFLLMVLAAGALAAAGCAKPVVRSCYTPGNKCMDAVVAEIGRAKSDVLVQAHALTAKPVTDALVAARDSGVNVSVILDRSYPFAQNSATYLAAFKSIPTFLDARHAVAGSNIIIIDRFTVITGSMLFTPEAEAQNADDVLIIASSSVADSYLLNWNEHKAHAEAVATGTTKQDPSAAVQPKNEKKKSVRKKGNSVKKKTP